MSAPSSPSAQPSVLVVEDEAIIRLGLAMDLEEAGFDVHEAENAEQAVMLLQDGTAVKAVITDLRMPGPMDGHGLALWISEHRPELPVIIASGYAVDLERELPAGFAVISKPYDSAQLVCTVARLTGASKSD
jgi:DNA-binding NtrC family response regulator